MPEITCGDCFHHRGEIADDADSPLKGTGECRALPPDLPVNVGPRHHVHTYRRTRDAEGACGLFRPRDGAPGDAAYGRAVRLMEAIEPKEPAGMVEAKEPAAAKSTQGPARGAAAVATDAAPRKRDRRRR